MQEMTVRGFEREGRKGLFSGKENVFLAAVFVLGFFLHLHLHSFVLISNDDDLVVFRASLKTRSEGFPQYWETACSLAKNQGRFYFVYTTIFTQIPYYIDTEATRASLLSLIYCLTGLLITFFIAPLWRENAAGLLFFPLYIFSMPIYGRWHPSVSWPMYWQVPVIVFVLSQFICIRAFYNRNQKHDYRCILPYLVLAFFSISFNESLFFNFCLVSLSVFVIHELRIYERLALSRRLALRFLLLFSPYAAFLGLWFSFEMKHPGRVGKIEKIQFDATRYGPTGRESALVTFTSKPDQFIVAMPSSCCAGELRVAEETRPGRAVVLGSFQKEVYLDTIGHQDFNPFQ